MWKEIKNFLSPPNTPVVSEKSKAPPKPETDKALKDALRGKVQRSRMDDAIRNSGG